MPRSLFRRPLDVDPLVLAARVAQRPGSVLLHSQRGWHGRDASALLIDPVWTLTQRGSDPPRWSGRVPDSRPPDIPPLELPAHFAARLETFAAPDSGLPLPGIAGFVSYEAGVRAQGVEPAGPAPFDLDDLWLGAYDAVVHFDDDGVELRVADLGDLVPTGVRLEERADVLADLLQRQHLASISSSSLCEPGVTPLDRAWHRDAMARIDAHLRDGDVYQINLTGFVRAVTEADAWDVFRVESRDNPTAFAAWIRTEGACVTSHSPERLLAVNADRVSTAPIKGTLASGSTADTTLRASAKDRAEHVMIVDLCRNDLGRHAVPGSVRVESLFEGLELRGLVHLVSRISARVPRDRQKTLLGDLFPGGSITGAPKRRAMEIISGLEQHARGPYTGAIGYAAPGGDMDWNIAIRTSVWQNGAAHFGCGGGIVLDSDPDREYDEAMLKAKSFLESLRRTSHRPPEPGAEPAP